MLTLGDNIYFDYIQECPECTKKINIELICKNYQKMEKNLLWAQCPYIFVMPQRKASSQ